MPPCKITKHWFRNHKALGSKARGLEVLNLTCLVHQKVHVKVKLPQLAPSSCYYMLLPMKASEPHLHWPGLTPLILVIFSCMEINKLPKTTEPPWWSWWYCPISNQSSLHKNGFQSISFKITKHWFHNHKQWFKSHSISFGITKQNHTALVSESQSSPRDDVVQSRIKALYTGTDFKALVP